MAGHRLIDAYLADLAHRLPGPVVDELADGLAETWHHHQLAGLGPTEAGQAAIAEFGSVAQVTRAFVAQAPGRRRARLLLLSGPAVGAVWGVGLVAGHAWTWPIPRPFSAAYVVTLLAVVAALALAATSRHSYRRTRLGTPACLGLAGLDATMLTTVAVLHPAGPAWPLLAAVAASLTRIAVTLRYLRHRSREPRPRRTA